MKWKCIPITPRVLAAILILTSATHAADWMQFRGPNGSGISSDAKPPTAWSDAQNIKWKTPLPGGGTSSPILYKDSVIISASEESHAVYALDTKTGQELWKAEGGPLSYVFGTPIIAEHAGRADLLLSMPDELWALNPATGKLRWHADSGLPGNIAPSVVVGDGVAFAFGGFPRLGAVAVKLGGQGDVTQSNVVWLVTHNQLVGDDSDFNATPALADRQLFLRSNRNHYCIESVQTAGGGKVGKQ